MNYQKLEVDIVHSDQADLGAGTVHQNFALEADNVPNQKQTNTLHIVPVDSEKVLEERKADALGRSAEEPAKSQAQAYSGGAD
ncbi:hypothetical protein BN14_07774 [Rhizoctonia solani AG-1 IB]|uniref:Uncharacterized protein n=1 Tax=Thanatephorus cucumeris (strain AG1-IB / isolate 7/3/14) TaxID=1108050 RepID=M5C2X0_THACB|nr:hypothetical protein BN14_07774 [Rhizoctonia solani AG-1 IB]